ncbi:histidine phosphotransferase family protein [Paracoccus sp. (in: a-proteobacteria)]|uniref:histidine phosphotransferase family protein n=1 Tax=Paracoccus sp. TaxID=267 RepID=UPI0026E0618A|nr:histidine phosphotransferase family protein [Paracoccus sp. (in: a-proteobacteria)]MDO5647447.1 histidine phosphotransferase family protein [Paracoccus sp. (in: a-proteobacteria)]
MTTETTRITGGDLAALVGSRLCHDLVSPLGAIGNGVELLEMSPDFPGLSAAPEMALIAESIAAARARIQAFRMAFGSAAPDQRVGGAELSQLLAGLSAQGRLRLELNASGDFARPDVRMLILAVMCLETGLPWGGRVIILHTAPGWRLVAEATRTRPDPALWAWLGGENARSPVASEVHFPLLAEAARQAGRVMEWELDETGAEIRF